jgi:hypothetical protein
MSKQVDFEGYLTRLWEYQEQRHMRLGLPARGAGSILARWSYSFLKIEWQSSSPNKPLTGDLQNNDHNPASCHGPARRIPGKHSGRLVVTMGEEKGAPPKLKMTRFFVTVSRPPAGRFPK